ncbi:hypothetical protein AC629_40245 [Bradyrhizobium sp. NAS80.1]|nr:hypothetical protein AC629_40245 [Bradyrhizobium sp. NAS80.1]
MQPFAAASGEKAFSAWISEAAAEAPPNRRLAVCASRRVVGWIAVVEVDSLVTRDRIQAAVRRLRELYDLT